MNIWLSPQGIWYYRKVALESGANVLLIFHVVPLGSCFPQSLPVASIAIASSLFSPRYNPFFEREGLVVCLRPGAGKRQTVGKPEH